MVGNAVHSAEFHATIPPVKPDQHVPIKTIHAVMDVEHDVEILIVEARQLTEHNKMQEMLGSLCEAT